MVVIDGMKPIDDPDALRALCEYERAMELTIQQMIADRERRLWLADEARRRIMLPSL